VNRNGLHASGPRGLPDDIHAVVFDFDDTIAETLGARIEATRLTFARVGIHAPSPEEFVTASRGVPLQVALDSFDGGRGAEMGLLKIYRTVYWHKEPGFLRMFNGVAELLNGLAGAGLPMGVLTSKARDIVVEGRRAGVLTELDELGIADLFGHVIGVEDVTHPKPHPEGLERLLGHLDVAPERTLVVGDSHTDIQAAHNAGCWSCLALWGVPEDEHGTPLTTPDLVAHDPGALHRLLLS
jgi:pyrophosphatase PpaX